MLHCAWRDLAAHIHNITSFILLYKPLYCHIESCFLVQCILKGSRVCKYVLHRICVCMKHKYNMTNRVCFWASITFQNNNFGSKSEGYTLKIYNGYWIVLSCTTGNSLSHWKPCACIRVGVHRETRQEMNWIFPSDRGISVILISRPDWLTVRPRVDTRRAKCTEHTTRASEFFKRNMKSEKYCKTVLHLIKHWNRPIINLLGYL